MALHDTFPGEQKWNTPEGCQWALDAVQKKSSRSHNQITRRSSR